MFNFFLCHIQIFLNYVLHVSSCWALIVVQKVYMIYYFTIQPSFGNVLLMGKNPDGLNGRLFRLLLEYLRDSNRSDKQIAKVLGVSQPTISRMKRKLVEDGLVEHFSVIPNFSKMGYEIMAFSFVKFNMNQVMEIEENAKDWAQSHPEIIFTSRAEDMGMDAVTVSLHKDYAAYKDFLAEKQE